jgi:hypothetical protein
VRLRILKSFATERMAPQVGDIVEVPAEAAKDWLNAGFAEPAGDNGEDETGAFAGGPENTTARPQRNARAVKK